MTGERSSEQATAGARDLSGAVVALAIAGVAGLALWQAREFSEFGSIFPIVIASALLAGSLAVMARSLVSRVRAVSAPTADEGHHGLLRSFALIAVLVVWVVALEWTGFVMTSAAGFLSIALIADSERPTLARSMLYAGVAIAVVGALKILFQYALKVRLPTGDLVTWLLG